MRIMRAALAAWLVLLASPALATTPWNLAADFGTDTRILNSSGTSDTISIGAGVPRWWKSGDTDDSPIITSVSHGGAMVAWYGGAGASSLTVFYATGSAASPGHWNVLDVYPSGASCASYPASCIYLPPGNVYKFRAGDTSAGDGSASAAGTAASDSQLRVMGLP